MKNKNTLATTPETRWNGNGISSKGNNNNSNKQKPMVASMLRNAFLYMLTRFFWGNGKLNVSLTLIVLQYPIPLYFNLLQNLK
ncbi:MAG TPA: hypothetical protein DCL43_06785 [Chitinophagaceae bacterium]|nr:hypothetical protein [Chitinophagaceae bacterium]HAN40277.1 hypothetical protein [Chitinophagaceae bacterium]